MRVGPIYIVAVKPYLRPAWPEVEYVGRNAFGWPKSPLHNPYDRKHYGNDPARLLRLFAEDLAGGADHLIDRPRFDAEIDRLAAKLRAEGRLILGCWCADKHTACHARIVAEHILQRLSANG